MHESEKWKWSRSVMSDSWQSHGLQPTRLLHPWDFPGKGTGVDCHCLQVSSLSLIQMASSVILHDYIDNMRKIAFRKNTVKVLCIFLKDKVFTFSLCTFWVRDLSERAIKVLPIFVAAQHNSKLKYQENLRRKKKKEHLNKSSAKIRWAVARPHTDIHIPKGCITW